MFLLSIGAEHPHRLHSGSGAAAHTCPPRHAPSPGSLPAAETLHQGKFRVLGDRLIILNTNEASCRICLGFFGRYFQPCSQAHGASLGQVLGSEVCRLPPCLQRVGTADPCAGRAALLQGSALSQGNTLPWSSALPWDGALSWQRSCHLKSLRWLRSSRRD